MDMCHTIIVLPDETIHHAIISWAMIEERYQVLSGPHTLKNLSYPLVAVREKSLGFTLEQGMLECQWSLLITDDLAQKPLIQNQSQARSLFWLGELIGGIACSFTELGLPIKSLTPCQQSGFITLDFSFAKPCSTFGVLLCMITAIDALLFSRGLLIKKSEFYIKDSEHRVPTFFINSLNGLFEPHHDSNRNIA